MHLCHIRLPFSISIIHPSVNMATFLSRSLIINSLVFVLMNTLTVYLIVLSRNWRCSSKLKVFVVLFVVFFFLNLFLDALIFLIRVNWPFPFSMFPECHFLIKLTTVFWCSLHHVSFILWDFQLTQCPEGTFISNRCLDHSFLSPHAVGEGNKNKWTNWRSTVNQL